MSIKTAVIPVAGLGTRFLPASKAIPKEMLPVVDRPVIQIVVEEAVAAGIENIVLVTGQGKSAIEDHFDVDVGLEFQLKDRNKTEIYERIHGLSRSVNVITVRQKEPLGLGHAVLCAQPVVGDAPFAVLLGDDIIDAEKPTIGRMAEIHAASGKGVVAVMEVPREQTQRYGVVTPSGDADGEGVLPVSALVEKPKPEDAPSNLAVIGRYLLPGEIFEDLATLGKGAGGEIQLTDALQRLAQRDKMCAFQFPGDRYDAGDQAGFVAANIAYAMKRDDLREEVTEALRRWV